MQKVLTEMNVQIANVISDISGVTGMAILDAILKGERDRYQLADLANPRIQALEERDGGVYVELEALALTGTFRLLFAGSLTRSLPACPGALYWRLLSELARLCARLSRSRAAAQFRWPAWHPPPHGRAFRPAQPLPWWVRLVCFSFRRPV